MNTFTDKSTSAGVSVNNPDFFAAATAGVKVPTPPDRGRHELTASPAIVHAGEERADYFGEDQDGFIEVKRKTKKAKLAVSYKGTIHEISNANSLMRAHKMTIRNVQKFTFMSRLWHDVKVERFENGQSAGYVSYGDRNFIGTPVVKVHGSNAPVKCWDRKLQGTNKRNFCSYTLSEGKDRFGKACPVAHFKLCTFHEFSKQFNMEAAQNKLKQQQKHLQDLRVRLAGLDTIKFLRSKPKALDDWEKEVKVWDYEDLNNALRLWFEFGIYSFYHVDPTDLWEGYGPIPEGVTEHELGVQFATLPTFANPCVRMWHVVNTAISQLARRKGIMIFIPISRVKIYLCNTTPGPRNPGMAILADINGGELSNQYCYNISLPDFEEGGHILIPDQNVYIENTSAIRKYVDRSLHKWTAIVIEDESIRRLFYKAALDKFKNMSKENFRVTTNAENPKLRKVLKPEETEKLWPAIEAFVQFRARNPDRSVNYLAYIGKLLSFDRHKHVVVNVPILEESIRLLGQRGGFKPGEEEEVEVPKGTPSDDEPVKIVKPEQGEPSIVKAESGDKVVAIKKEQKVNSEVIDLMSENKPFDNKKTPVVKGPSKTKAEKNKIQRQKAKEKKNKLKLANKISVSSGEIPTQAQKEQASKKPEPLAPAKKYVPVTFESEGVKYSVKGVDSDWKISIASSGWCAVDCVINTLDYTYPEIFSGQSVVVKREFVAFYARVSSGYSACPDYTKKVIFEKDWLECDHLVQTYLALGIKAVIYQVKHGIEPGDMLKIVKAYEGETMFSKPKTAAVIYYNKHFDIVKPNKCSMLIAESDNTFTVHANFIAHGGINHTRGTGWNLTEQCRLLISRFVAERSLSKDQSSIFFKRQYCVFAMWSFSETIGLIQLYPATQISQSEYRDVVTKQPLDETEVKQYSILRKNYPQLKCIIPQVGFMKEIKDEVNMSVQAELKNLEAPTPPPTPVKDEVKVEDVPAKSPIETADDESSDDSEEVVQIRKVKAPKMPSIDALDLARCAFKIGSHAATIHCMNQAKPKEDPKDNTHYYHHQHDFDVAVSNIEEKYKTKLRERELEMERLQEEFKTKVYNDLMHQIEVDKVNIEELKDELSQQNKEMMNNLHANNTRLASIVELTTKLQGYVEALDERKVTKKHWILRALDFIFYCLGFREYNGGGGKTYTKDIFDKITNPVDTTKSVAKYVKNKTQSGYSYSKACIVKAASKINPFKHGEESELKVDVEFKGGKLGFSSTIKSRYWNWAVKAGSNFKLSFTKTLGRFGFERAVNVDVDLNKNKKSYGVVEEKGRISTGVFTLEFTGSNNIQAKYILDKSNYHRVIQSSEGKVKPFQLKWCNFLDALHDPTQTGGGWRAGTLRALLAFSVGGAAYSYAPKITLKEINNEVLNQVKEIPIKETNPSHFGRNTCIKVILTTGISMLMNAIANRHWNLMRHPRGGSVFKIPGQIEVPFRHRYDEGEIEDINSNCIVMKAVTAKEVLADVFIEKNSPTLLTQANNTLWSTAVAPRLPAMGKTLTHPDFRIVEHKFWVKAHAEPTMLFVRACLSAVNTLSWIPSPVLTFCSSFLPSHWSVVLSTAIGMQELLDLLIFRMTYRLVTYKYLVAFGAIGLVNYNPAVLTGISPASVAAKRQAIQMNVTTWFNNFNMSCAQNNAMRALSSALGCQGSWETGTTNFALARYDHSIASSIAMSRT